MNPKNNCPYKASGNNVCTHKSSFLLKKRKRYCPYNKADKCPLYQEWVDYNRIREDALRSLSGISSNIPGDNSGSS